MASIHDDTCPEEDGEELWRRLYDEQQQLRFKKREAEFQMEMNGVRTELELKRREVDELKQQIVDIQPRLDDRAAVQQELRLKKREADFQMEMNRVRAELELKRREVDELKQQIVDIQPRLDGRAAVQQLWDDPVRDDEAAQQKRASRRRYLVAQATGTATYRHHLRHIRDAGNSYLGGGNHPLSGSKEAFFHAVDQMLTLYYLVDPSTSTASTSPIMSMSTLLLSMTSPIISIPQEPLSHCLQIILVIRMSGEMVQWRKTSASYLKIYLERVKRFRYRTHNMIVDINVVLSETATSCWRSMSIRNGVRVSQARGSRVILGIGVIWMGEESRVMSLCGASFGIKNIVFTKHKA